MLKRFRAVLALAILVILSTEAWSVQMDAVAGFGGLYREGNWFPVSVSLNNPDRDTLAGTIALYDLSGKQPSAFQTPFEISGPSQKRYTYYCNQELPGTNSISVLRLLPTKGKLSEQELQTQCRVNTVDPSNAFAVVVGSPQSTLNFLNGITVIKGNPSTGVADCNIQVGLADPSTLPDRPLGFDSVDLLVLADFEPGRSDPKQLAALKMWVAGGGTLVVNGGANFQRLQNEFYTDLLPVDVTATSELDTLGAMITAFGHTMTPGRSAVATGELKPGSDVIVAQNSVPLIAHRAYGLGEVYFLAVDYTAFPLKGWDGQIEMWKSILIDSKPTVPMASPSGFLQIQGNNMSSTMPAPSAPGTVANKPPTYQMRPHYSPYMSPSGSNSFEAIASDVPSVAPPAASTIFAFLIAYLVCLVPVNYFILTKKKRRELAWITTPAIILIFTIGAYGIGYAMRGGKLLLKTITIVEGGRNSRYASINSYGGLFSPSRRNYDIIIDDPYAVVSETPTDKHSPSRRSRSLQIRLGETTELPDIEMDMWSMRTFRVESGCDLTGTVESSLKYDRKTQRITGSIINNTDYGLKDCTLIVSGCNANIGPVAKKSSTQIDTHIQNKYPPISAPSHATISPAAEMRINLIQTIVSRIPAARQDEVVLLGWLDHPPSTIKLSRGRGERQNANCFVYWLGPAGG